MCAQIPLMNNKYIGRITDRERVGVLARGDRQGPGSRLFWDLLLQALACKIGNRLIVVLPELSLNKLLPFPSGHTLGDDAGRGFDHAFPGDAIDTLMLIRCESRRSRESRRSCASRRTCGSSRVKHLGILILSFGQHLGCELLGLLGLV